VSSRSAWPAVRLGELLSDIQPGFACGVHNSNGSGLPHLRPMNVSTEGRIDRSETKFIRPELASRTERRLQDGDVLFNNTNSPELVGKTALFSDKDQPAFSNHMTRLRADEARVVPAFLALALHQAWRDGWYLAHCNNHVSQASISRSVLQSLAIPLPPVDIQRQICSLHDLIAEGRRSSATHLAAARRALARFRQSVLTAGCSGRLTDDWRARQGREDSDLPAGWRDVSFGEVCQRVTVGYVGKMISEYRPTGIPFLRSQNVRELRFDRKGLKFISAEFHSRIAKSALQPGDIVVVRSGFVGTACVIPPDLPEANCSDLVIARPGPDLRPAYGAIYINSGRMKAHISDVKVGSAQSHFNTKSMHAAPLLLPPADEQDEIVRRVNLMLAGASTLDTHVTRTDSGLDLAMRTILAHAFTNQSATDE
jgi:type I restriction enzyme S subunit